MLAIVHSITYHKNVLFNYTLQLKAILIDKWGIYKYFDLFVWL